MRVVVIHYDLSEVHSLCDRIRREGFEASAYPCRGPSQFRNLAADPPDAIVIDLMRTPSYGRIMGALLRERKSTRTIPLVFIEGDPEKTEKTRALLPDATFAELLRIGPALRRLTRQAAAEPVVPSGFGTPLLQKLNIRQDSVVAILHPPDGFPAALEPFPDGVRLQNAIKDADVILAFAKSAALLGRELPSLAREMRKGRTLWICWPKKSGSLAGSLTMVAIREICQAVGLTDYKVCSLDNTWSAMAIGRRR